MRPEFHACPALWDPSDEKSSCGVGFITRKDGVQSHEVITLAAEALCSVPHRGGVNAEGGGVSTDLSQAYFRKVTGRADLRLGRFCVGNFFLPNDDDGAARAARLITSTMTDRGFAVLTEREVPVDESVLPAAGPAAQLPIRQWVFAAPEPCPAPAMLDQVVQEALLHIEAIAYADPALTGLYPLSLSARTQVLKGRLSSHEVIGYFTDLHDPVHAVHTLYFHTRFSTNTDPHPTMAQPFRYLLYQAELDQLLSDGLLTRLDLAFSRDQTHKVYVQDRMREQGAGLYRWLERGAHVYVCGDAQRMAHDVDAALIEIVAEHGGMDAEKAGLYLSDLKKEKRYCLDVY